MPVVVHSGHMFSETGPTVDSKEYLTPFVYSGVDLKDEGQILVDTAVKTPIYTTAHQARPLVGRRN